MSAIIQTQPYDIRIQTFLDLSTATETKIIYKTPSGTVGELSATVDDTTKLKARVTGALNTEYGYWFFHGSALFDGMDTPILSEVVPVLVHQKFYDKKIADRIS